MVKRVLTKTLKLLVGDDLSLGLPKLRKKTSAQETERARAVSARKRNWLGTFWRGAKGSSAANSFAWTKKHGCGMRSGLMLSTKLKTHTIKYEVTDRGILKTQPGPRYSYLEGDELRNFSIATQMYYEQVARQVYKRDPETGEKLV